MADKRNTDAALLEQLLETPGWRILEKELQKNLAWLTDKVLDAQDESLREVITISKRELFLKFRDYQKFVLDLPWAIIKSYQSDTPISGPTDFDPYTKESEIQKRIDGI